MSKKKGKKNKKLPEGTYSAHESGKVVCTACEPFEILTHIGDGRELRIRNRTYRCPEHDDEMTSFILGLEHLKHRLSPKPFPICRFCTHHQNHHVHVYDHLYRGNEVNCEQLYGPIEDSEAMIKAYNYSHGRLSNDYEGLVKKWLSRWNKHG